MRQKIKDILKRGFYYLSKSFEVIFRILRLLYFGAGASIFISIISCIPIGCIIANDYIHSQSIAITLFIATIVISSITFILHVDTVHEAELLIWRPDNLSIWKKIRNWGYIFTFIIIGISASIATNGYIKKRRIENTVELFIRYDVDPEYNHSVGNDWSFKSYINGELLPRKGVSLQYICGQPLTITSVATEYDPSNDDVREVSKKVSFKKKELNAGYSQTVIVTEGNGKYAGNTAKWTFNYSVEIVHKPSEEELKYKYATSEIWHRYKYLFKDRDAMEQILKEKHTAKTVPADTSKHYMFATDSLWREYGHLFLNRDAMEKCIWDTKTNEWIKDFLKTEHSLGK